MKDQKFALVMSAEDKSTLHDLAYQERVSAAELLRRLIAQAAKQTPPSAANRVGDAA